MEFKIISATNKIWILVLMLCMSKACHGQLMCYVCDNCVQVNSATPQFECSENFFHTSAPTDTSVQTTTELTTTTTADATTLMPTTINTEEATEPTIRSTTTTESKSSESTTNVTPQNATETTAEMSPETTITQVSETNDDRPPTPPTVRPSSPVPTPPNPGTVKPLDDVDALNNQSIAHRQHVNKDEVEEVDLDQGTNKTYKPSAEFRVRQLRSVTDVTYHCFKVKATVNGTMVVNRGCSRVQTSESVCSQWESQHPNEKMNKCYPCSRTKCNGTSALSVSITALFVAVVAVLMHQ